MTNPQRSNFEDIVAFHKKFGLEAPEGHPGSFTDDATARDYRIKFMQEELQEYIEGHEEGDHEKMFDALIDLVYVAMGTAYLQGYPWQEGWDAVQQANMAKVRATSAAQSKRGSSLDVVKPAGWTPPNIAGILLRRGFGW